MPSLTAAQDSSVDYQSLVLSVAPAFHKSLQHTIDVLSEGSVVALPLSHKCIDRPYLPWLTWSGTSYLQPKWFQAMAICTCPSSLVGVLVSGCIEVMSLPGHDSHGLWPRTAGWHPDPVCCSPITTEISVNYVVSSLSFTSGQSSYLGHTDDPGG